MKVTFPHMGSTYVPIKMILEELNIDVVCPPRCNKKTLEIGSKCSPEGICVPFKLNMGNYIEAIEQGADTVFMLTGCGPCRFGVFSSLQQEILEDLGYEVDFLSSDRFSSVQGFKEFFKILQDASHMSYAKILNTVRRGYKTLALVDEFHDLTNSIRPKELNKGEVDRLYQSFLDDVMKVKGYKSTKSLVKIYMDKLKRVPINSQKDVIKIGIIGEIYTIIESFINLNLERKLGNMGIEVHRSTPTIEFVREQMEFIPFIKSERKDVFKAAKPYLEAPIGGHGIHTIGNAVRYSEQGYDGLIHILPFTCMPEIVARSITPQIEQDHQIPILTLVVDEMTGEAGYNTRLEAFVDLLMKRREMVASG